MLGVGVDLALAGDGHILGLGDVDEAGQAVQGVALPAGQIVLIHLVVAADHTGQDGIVGAVVVAQDHRALLQIQGGVALEEQAGGAVAAGGQVDGAARRAGGQGGLQPGGVVGDAVPHQSVAGGVHKKALLPGDEAGGERLAAGAHGQGVGMGGLEGIDRKDVGVAGVIDLFAVQKDGERLRRAEAQAVFQLKDGAAGHGADQGQFHKKIILSLLFRVGKVCYDGKNMERKGEQP